MTNGKIPNWINPNHPKLVLVKHSDYMPEKYLPTFNSRAIELNFHRISELSEHFVYFNDDMFINRPVSSEYYFKNGLPCDSNEETLFFNPSWDPKNNFSTIISIYCDLAILNYHFKRRDVAKSAMSKWFGSHLGIVGILTSLLIYKSSRFQFFKWRHYEQPMLKSVIQEIWNVEGDMADQSCTQFRHDVSFNPYIIRYWQFASNKFVPMKLKCGKLFTVRNQVLKDIVKVIRDRKLYSVCLNDTPYCSDSDFEESKKTISEVFEEKFPLKSQFEI